MSQEVKDTSVTEYPKAARIPWPLIIVSLILMVTLGVAWNTLIPSSIWLFYNPGSVNCSEEFSALPYLVILLSVPVYKLLSRKMNGETLTYLYVVSMLCSYTAVGYGAFRIPPGIISQRWLNPSTVSPLIPELLAPRAEIAQQLINGGVPIPWISWMPTILYWWLLFSSFEIYMLSMGTIWGKQWIQVEQVPFPQTLAVHEVYEQASTKKSLKPYLAGVALGFAFQFIVFLIMTFPWFPDIYGWRVNTECYGSGWLPSGSSLYNIIGLAFLSKNPSIGALFYMAPLSTLLSSVIFTIAFFILTQVAYMMGYYTGIPMDTACGCPSRDGFWDWQPPFKWNITVNMGGGLGLVTMYLFLQRRYVANAFRSLWGNAQDEDQRLMRTALISTAGSYVLVVVLLLIAGLGFLSAALMPIMVWVLFFAALFVFSRTGYNAIGLGAYGLYWLRAIWPTLPQTTNTDYVLTAMLARQNGSDGLSLCWGGSLASAFAGYKFANLTKTSAKNIFRVMLFTVILIPILWWLTLLVIAYSQGLARMPFYSATSFPRDISYATDPTIAYGGIAPEVTSGGPWIPYLLLGMLIVWALSILHATYVSFPLDPYGFLLTFAARSFSEGIWIMVVIAWLLKLVTLRIGGSRAYERLGIPAATGFLLGYALAILFGGVISAVRFFIPF